MNKKLYEETSQRVLDSFQEILTLMDNINDPDLQLAFMVWKAQEGVGFLLKKFLFAEGIGDKENQSNENKPSINEEGDGISHYLKSEVDNNEKESIFSDEEITHKYLKKEKKEKEYTRGPYKKYSDEEKLKAIRLYENGHSLTRISKKLHIPIKNIKRWSEKGVSEIENKKNDSLFEEELKTKIRELSNTSVLSIELIKAIIEEFPPNSGLRNSKAWIINFVERHDLSRFIDIEE